MDLYFLTNPLKDSVWLTLLMVLFAFFGFFFTMFKLFGFDEDNMEKSFTFKAIVLTFWMHCVLLFAYYGGAITTDLTVHNAKAPFSSYSEVT